MTWSVVLECLGIVASCGLIITDVIFLIMLRKEWITTRAVVVALVPIAICAGCS